MSMMSNDKSVEYCFKLETSKSQIIKMLKTEAAEAEIFRFSVSSLGQALKTLDPTFRITKPIVSFIRPSLHDSICSCLSNSNPPVCNAAFLLQICSL